MMCNFSYSKSTTTTKKIRITQKHSVWVSSPMTELTFLDVFFPKAQMQAHSAGTVKLANDHWLSTYWPITGPTFPTRASLPETEEETFTDKKRPFVSKRNVTGGQGSVLRGAAVEFCVFECEDVNGAFVTGGTQERGVMAEVDAGKVNKARGKTVRAWSKLEHRCFLEESLEKNIEFFYLVFFAFHSLKQVLYFIVLYLLRTSEAQGFKRTENNWSTNKTAEQQTRTASVLKGHSYSFLLYTHSHQVCCSVCEDSGMMSSWCHQFGLWEYSY